VPWAVPCTGSRVEGTCRKGKPTAHTSTSHYGMEQRADLSASFGCNHESLASYRSSEILMLHSRSERESSEWHSILTRVYFPPHSSDETRSLNEVSALHESLYKMRDGLGIVLVVAIDRHNSLISPVPMRKNRRSALRTELAWPCLHDKAANAAVLQEVKIQRPSLLPESTIITSAILEICSETSRTRKC